MRCDGEQRSVASQNLRVPPCLRASVFLFEARRRGADENVDAATSGDRQTVTRCGDNLGARARQHMLDLPLTPRLAASLLAGL